MVPTVRSGPGGRYSLCWGLSGLSFAEGHDDTKSYCFSSDPLSEDQPSRLPACKFGGSIGGCVTCVQSPVCVLAWDLCCQASAALCQCAPKFVFERKSVVSNSWHARPSASQRVCSWGRSDRLAIARKAARRRTYSSSQSICDPSANAPSAHQQQS
jgi:hypothetical protein